MNTDNNDTKSSRAGHWSREFPWRQIQTNLPEIAMDDIDAEQYVNNLKEMHATVAMINTSGIIASYKTDLPFHFQSPHLTSDSLERIIAVCHREGIKVVARTDFSKVRRPIYEQHPEWACIYPGGVIEDYNGNVHCCVNGDYQRIYAPKIIEETLTQLDVDGIFFNMGGYSTRNYDHNYLGICQCENCKTLFQQRFGLPLPEKEDSSDPAYRKYQIFKKQTVRECKKTMVSLIKSIRPNLMIDRTTEEDFGFVRSESNTEFGRALPHWQYSASDNTKRAVTSHPNLIASNTSVDFIGYFYRHVAVSPAQQELRLWQNLAACGGLDYYLIGRLDNHCDRSGFERVKRVFSFHEKHFETTYKGLRPDSPLLLVNGGEYRGWFRMLTENHVPFDLLNRDKLEAIDLNRYKCVVLPNIKYLSDNEAQMIDDFVDTGGTLIAIGETGFGDEWFEDRNTCALKSLGIKANTKCDSTMRSAVLEVMDKETFPSMVDRDLLYIGDQFIFNEYEPTTKGMLRLIPPHQYGPPELCYWTEETDLPGLAINRFGKGKAVCFPWNPGSLFYREGHDNTLIFVRDVLTKIAGLPVIKGLSPMVEATMAKNPDSAFSLLQLVNTSGHFGNSFYDPVTMRDLSIVIPHDTEPRTVMRLSDGADVPFAYGDGRLTLQLDTLSFFEGIKII